ncbi:sigma-B regulation protein RsbU (phosphoserine phosphatase) [Rhodoligotrophos appendicifer]|uniref:SpoIIE family protein phosphatase n=1 Tax=Rhodoligotrophos appendicifer TaxID=987056 RepID=UPI00117F8896|nr:SpoIIE family protein phosphatase [Rhodoligotrophos appendicifer]
MLLRTRVTLLVTVVFAIAFGGLVLAGLQRERLAEVPYTRIGTTGQAALWREILDDHIQPLIELADQIIADPDLQRAVAARNVSEMRSLATAWTIPRFASSELTDLQILDGNGQIVFASSTAAEPPRLLDVSTIRAVQAGAMPQGIRQIASDRFRVIAARRYPVAEQSLVLALAGSANAALKRFAAAMNADVFLLSTRGRLVEGTADGLWGELHLDLPQRVATVTQAELDGKLFAVTAIPLDDLSAGTAGLLVTVQDATESLTALRRLTMLTVGAAIIMLVVLLAGLYFYLRLSFRPLDRAVSVLGALSRGDTSANLTKESDDEIGDIATAIQGLRQNLIALNDTRRQRELQRRRQERFVRRQMENLASTLEPGAREEVLTDLRRIVAATSGALPKTEGASDQSQSMARLIREDDQLGPLAAVLQQMSGRVVDQHRRLSELVTRLREALVRETQLASLQQELAIARDLQRSVLPIDFPDRERFSVFGLMESAREVGGDFYDFFDQNDGRFAFLIADVSGKGVPAAFFMAIARTLLKAIALFENDPAVCVRQLNELLTAGNDQMMFVTLFFCVLDPATGAVEYVNAGHNPPYRVGAKGVVALDPSDDIAVAIVSDTDFTTRRLVLEPGESLVLYTDGVTEAFNDAGDQFGELRLEETLRSHLEDEPAPLARATAEAVKTFESGHDQSDDVTLLVVKYRG